MVTWRHTLTRSTKSLSFSSEWRRVLDQTVFCLSTSWTECIFPALGMYISIRLWVRARLWWTVKVDYFIKMNWLVYCFTLISVKFCPQTHRHLLCGIKHTPALSVWQSSGQTEEPTGAVSVGNGPSARFFAPHLLFLTFQNSDRSARCSFNCWTQLESWDSHSWIYRIHLHLNLHNVQPEENRICLTSCCFLTNARNILKRNDFNNLCHYIVLPG